MTDDLFALVQNNALGKLDAQMRRYQSNAQKTQRDEVAATVYGAQIYTYATLPTPTSTMIGWMAFVSNGRKMGETAGNGSGVMVYCAETAKASGVYAWFRMSDDTQVAV